MTMDGTPETKAFKETCPLFLELVEPESLAWNLYSKDLIDGGVREKACQHSDPRAERAGRLLSTLEKVIKYHRTDTDKSTFEVFVEIVSKEKSLKPYYDELTSKYDSIRKKIERANTPGMNMIQARLPDLKTTLQYIKNNHSDLGEKFKLESLEKFLEKSDQGGADLESMKDCLSGLHNEDLLITEADYRWAVSKAIELCSSSTDGASSPPKLEPAANVSKQEDLFSKHTVYHASLCCLTVNHCDTTTYHEFINDKKPRHSFSEVSISRTRDCEVDRHLIAFERKRYYIAFKGEPNLSQWPKKFKSFEEGIQIQTNKIPLRFFIQKIIEGNSIVFTGSSFGGLLACSVTAKLCREPDLSVEQLQRNLVCITFGQPMVSINVIQETAQQIPVFNTIVHSVLLSKDVVPFVLRFLDTAVMITDKALSDIFSSLALKYLAEIQNKGKGGSSSLEQFKDELLKMIEPGAIKSSITTPVAGNIYKICNEGFGWKEFSRPHELLPLTEDDIKNLSCNMFTKHYMDEYMLAIKRGYLEQSPAYVLPPPCAVPTTKLPCLKPAVNSVSFHHFGKELAVVIEGKNLWFCDRIEVESITNGTMIEADKVSCRSIQFNYTPRDENEVFVKDTLRVHVHSLFSSAIRKPSITVKRKVYRFTYRQEQLAKHTPSELIELAYMSALLEQHPFVSSESISFSNRFQVLRAFLEGIGSVVPIESLVYAIGNADDELVSPCCKILIASGMKLPSSSCMQSGILRAVTRLKDGDSFERGKNLFEIEAGIINEGSVHRPHVVNTALEQCISEDIQANRKKLVHAANRKLTFRFNPHHFQQRFMQYNLQASVPIAYDRIIYIEKFAENLPRGHPNYHLIKSILKLAPPSDHRLDNVVCGRSIDLLYPVMSGATSRVKPPLDILIQGRKELAELIELSTGPTNEDQDKLLSQLYNNKMLQIINKIRQFDLKLCCNLLGSFMEEQMQVPFKKTSFDTAEAIASVAMTAAIGVWALFSLNYESLNHMLASGQLLVQVKDYIMGMFAEKTTNVDKEYAGKLQFMAQGLDKTVSCNSHYISYSLERQLVLFCDKLKITASTPTDYLVKRWNELFKNDTLGLVAPSHRPLIARWMRWALMVHNLREELARYTAVGVVGLVNSGKSKLVHNLFNIQVATGTTECKRTTVPFLYNLDDVVEGLDVIDFPGVDDSDGTIPNLAELLVSLAQVVVFVVDYRRVNTESAKYWLDLLDKEPVQVLICLTHADKLYVNEYMGEDGSHPPRDEARRKINEQLNLAKKKLELSPKRTIEYYSFCQDKDSTLNTEEGREILHDVGIGSSKDVGDWLVKVFREHMDQKELAERLHDYIYKTPEKDEQ